MKKEKRMKKYKLILLKDLPDRKAGTEVLNIPKRNYGMLSRTKHFRNGKTTK